MNISVNHVLMLIPAAALPLLVGCNELSTKVMDLWYEGTNIGVHQCVERNQNVGLRADVVKSLCLARNVRHIIIPPGQLEGRAGYTHISGNTFFSGWVTNKSWNKIITAIEIKVEHKNNIDEAGKQKNEAIQIEDLWIEPGQDHFFQISKLQFLPKEDSPTEEDKPLYSWSISSIRGLTVKLQ